MLDNLRSWGCGAEALWGELEMEGWEGKKLGEAVDLEKREQVEQGLNIRGH